MPDVFSKAKRSEVMSLIRSTGNKNTELKLATLMRQHGITGWRRQLPLKYEMKAVRPDFVFRRERVAVFVDGCFWHGCPRHLRVPKSNRKFWKEKLQRNQARDRSVTRGLKKAGWTVLRLWECALTKARTLRTIWRIERALGRIVYSAEDLKRFKHADADLAPYNPAMRQAMHAAPKQKESRHRP